MRRAVRYEVRLSYHDRIMKTLPEAMHAPDAQVMAAQPPGPEYDYDDPGTMSLHTRILNNAHLCLII